MSTFEETSGALYCGIPKSVFEVALVAAFVLAIAPDNATAAEPTPPSTLEMRLSQGSVIVKGIELRSGPTSGRFRYFSLSAAEKALGRWREKYVAGLGVTDYAWRDIGIHLQQGFRGADHGKLFKFQIFFDDSYNKDADKHSGKFTGTAVVDSVTIQSDSSLGAVQAELEAKGYHSAPDRLEKDEIEIITAGAPGRIVRIEVWCRS